ncbi:Prolargin [Merluccius polli]|uniref:Prolargin n=1 Tax=Merluccius polli TaxID=89951 RepID=A0AA47NCW5_MERPO|nr:Prolargin [Merluccius polli]
MCVCVCVCVCECVFVLFFPDHQWVVSLPGPSRQKPSSVTLLSLSVCAPLQEDHEGCCGTLVRFDSLPPDGGRDHPEAKEAHQETGLGQEATQFLGRGGCRPSLGRAGCRPPLGGAGGRPPLGRPGGRPPSAPNPRSLPDFPPVILGPPSFFADCPRECYCDPSYPSALNCENRNIRRVPVIPSRVHYLYLQNNYISELTAEPFANATELRWVNLANNRIKRIDKEVFGKVPSLLYLYLQKNQLREVPAQLPAGLEQLRLSKNRISKIPANAFKKLEHLALLDLHHNELSDRDLGKNTFKDLTRLIQLNLARNILKKMPAGVPASVIQLFLDKNSIEDIPKQSLVHLAFVRLNYNQLSDKGIPRAVFNLTTLLDLQLSHNQLSSVPLFNAHLEHLHLDHNSIESINGTQICPHSLQDDGLMPKLRYLRLDGNHLSPPLPMDVTMCFRHLHSVVI